MSLSPYTKSIQKVEAAEAHYYQVCDLGEVDAVIGEALTLLHKAKSEHIALFGCLRKTNGSWV